MGTAEGITVREMLAELVDRLGERDAYDGWMLGITAASVVATAAAVIVALLTSRAADRTAEDAQAVARDAAEASKQHAKAASAMLKIEQLRLNAEYGSRRAEPLEKLLGELAAYRRGIASPGFSGLEAYARLAKLASGVEGAVAGVRLVVQGDDVAVGDDLKDVTARIIALLFSTGAADVVTSVEASLVDWHRTNDAASARAALAAAGSAVDKILEAKEARRVQRAAERVAERQKGRPGKP